MNYSFLNLLFFVIVLSSCSKQEQKNCTLMKCKDVTISINEFNKDISNTDITQEELFDSYIEQLLLYDSAVQLNVEKNSPELIKNINYYQKEYLYQILKEKKSYECSVSDKQINQSISHFGNKIYECEYIWIPKKQRKIFKKVSQFLNQGASIGMLAVMDDNNTLPLLSNGVILCPSIQIFPGTFIKKIERKISDIEFENYVVVKTRRGYNIFKLKNKKVVYKPDKLFRKETKERIAFAKKIEEGKFWFDRTYFSSTIKIDEEEFDKIQFGINPLYCSDSIVAIFKGDTILWNDVVLKAKTDENKYLNLLRINNRATTIISMLINKTSGDFKIKRFADGLVVSDLIENKLAAKENFNDSLMILTSWFDSILTVRNNNKLFDDLVLEAKVAKIDKRDFIRKELDMFRTKHKKLFETPNDKRFYFNACKFPDIDSLKINYEALNENKFFNNEYEKSDLVAFTKEWELTKGDLLNVIDSLSTNSKELISQEDNLLKLVEYIAQNSGDVKNLQMLNVYKDKLKAPYYLPNYYIEKSDDYYIPEDKVIGSFNDSLITVRKVRAVVKDLPIEIQEKFIFVDSRKKALEDQIVKEYWFSKYNKELAELSCDPKVRTELQKIKQKAIINYFLNQEILVSPFSVNNNNLNFSILYSIKKLNLIRLEKTINKAIRSSDIDFNIRAINELGIDIAKSKYYKYIKNEN